MHTSASANDLHQPIFLERSCGATQPTHGCRSVREANAPLHAFVGRDQRATQAPGALPGLRRGIRTRTVSPFERPRPRLTERHSPEVAVRRSEFEPQISFALPAPRRHHFALHRLSCVLVQQNDGLVGSEFRIQRKQTSELTNRMSVRANDEVFAVERLPIHAEGHRQCHTRGATPFDAPIIGNLHVHASTRHVPAGRALSRIPCGMMLLRSTHSKKCCVNKMAPVTTCQNRDVRAKCQREISKRNVRAQQRPIQRNLV